ncbi:hydantoinase/oxoprolinase family protein [Synechococcus sp. OH2]|uniref:hydantoinase/oxoprolinase family protein n=1 Tax=Synechococcus sp. OH2 TaxID=136798 RepID=UPI0039C4BADB
MSNTRSEQAEQQDWRQEGLVRLGIDVGGTFTDLVLLQEGQIRTAKVLSTPSPEEGVFAALDKLGAVKVDVFCHGMTVATNALLERKGAPTLFLTTAGFRDVLAIGRQNRPSLYDLTQPKPEPVVPRHHCLEVKERCSASGVLEPLTEEEIQRVIREVGERVRRGGIRAVGVGFLFSFLYPEHEQRLGAALREALPGLHVSLSCEVTPEFREYERFSTTAIDAYLSPALAGYLHRLAQGCRERGIPAPLIMQSSGGVTSLAQAAAHASVALLSGPAGGVYGAAYVGRLSGYSHLLSLDMGGTSTDVALIQDGLPQVTPSAVVCGLPVQQPQIDIHTVSAGGGSLALLLPGGGLQVGPESAGSNPGPACYGRGGTAPTVTDANLWLGYLPDGGWLGDSVCLRRDLAGQAIATLAEPLGLSLEETAVGIRTLANVAMARALRVISVERGLDPADFALLAFGGAGPMHACALAEELGIRRILIPAFAGVLSALGMAVANLQRDYRRAILQPLRQLESAAEGSLLAPWAAPLIRQAKADLQEPELYFSLDLRYRGQSFELEIPAQLSDPVSLLEQRFHQAHQQRHGWQDPSQVVEAIQLRLRAVQALPSVPLQAPPPLPGDPFKGERQAWMGGQMRSVPVYDRRRMEVGFPLRGPAIVEMPKATVVIEAGWTGSIDAVGTLVLSCE